jgi:hypothetical protein
MFIYKKGKYNSNNVYHKGYCGCKCNIVFILYGLKGYVCIKEEII